MDTYNKPKNGVNIQYELNINLYEAINGCIKEIKINYQKLCEICKGIGKINYIICDKCHGENIDCDKCNNIGFIYLNKCPLCNNGHYDVEKTIKIIIKENINNNTEYLIKDFNEGINGGSNGTLKINIKIVDTDEYKLINNKDIESKINIDYKDAILGKTLIITNIYNKKIKVIIPQYSQYNDRIKIINSGLFDNKEQKYGDMYIILNINLPRQLTNEQKDIIRKL